MGSERSDHIYVKINASVNSFIRAKKNWVAAESTQYLCQEVQKGKRDDLKATVFSRMKILLWHQIKFQERFKKSWVRFVLMCRFLNFQYLLLLLLAELDKIKRLMVCKVHQWGGKRGGEKGKSSSSFNLSHCLAPSVKSRLIYFIFGWAARPSCGD